MRFLSVICLLYCFCSGALGAESKIERIDGLITAAHSRGVFNGVVLVATTRLDRTDQRTASEPGSGQLRFPG